MEATESTQKRKRLLGIKNKIALAFVFFLIVPSVVILVVSLVNVSGLGADVSQISGTALRDEQYRSIEEVAGTKADYIDEVLGTVADEVEMLAAYASDLFNGRAATQPRASYFHNDSANNPPPGYRYDTEEYDRWISTQASCYVVPWSNLQGKAHYTDQNATMNFTIQTSAHLDYMFQQMKTTRPEYAWIYMGFEIGMHRSYPWHSYSSSYDPRLRPWYQQGEAAAGATVFTSPYIDSSGRGLMISVAKAVYYDNGTILGVCAADLTIDTLRQTILATRILTSGYAFLVDDQGNAVAHPDLSGVDTHITALESSGSTFQGHLTQMLAGNNGTGTYQKEGRAWVIAYDSVPSTGYAFAVVVPENEITAPADQVRQQILDLISAEFWIMLLIFVGVVVVIGVTSNFVSRRIVKPITDLTKMMNFIADGDVSREIPMGVERKPDEVTELTTSFQNLVTVLRLGNADYYRGDLNKAARNYARALEIFSAAGNTRGMGTCYNNMANIQRIEGDAANAEKNYKNAIGIAKELGDQHALAMRHNNLAQLYADTDKHAQAEKHFELALAAYEGLHDQKGVAQVKRNMGLLRAKSGKIDEGKRLIQEANTIDERLENKTGIAYNQFYLGYLAREAREPETAAAKLETSFELSDQQEDQRLTANILKELEQTYHALRDNAKAHRTRVRYERLRKSLMLKKFVVFVIDVSGSMEGTRMQAAVSGALEVLDEHVNPQDVVSVVWFHSISEVLLPPTQMRGNEERIRDTIANIRATRYQTALFDAVGDALEIVNQRVGNEHKWIITLTDGMDNTSKKYNIADRRYSGMWKFMNSDKRVGLGEYIEENLLNVNLIIIGLDDEIRQIEPQLRALCERNQQGRYIAVPNLYDTKNAIQQAFQEVQELLAQINVEDFIPEEA